MTSRRGFLMLSAGALAAPALAPAPALAQLPPNIVALRKAALDEAVRKVTGGAPVREARVHLDLPPLIDNGNAVPITVSVDSPMTREDHVRSIHVFIEKNPQPNVIDARLGPRAGVARLTSRIRIADTGFVLAIAQTSDGTFWSGRADVLVTLSACLEEGLI